MRYRKYTNIMGYTNKDYLRAFFDYHGIKSECITGKTVDITPLLPFILADVGYGYYAKYVMPLKLKFELKKVRTRMVQAYTRFNSDLFNAFSAYDREHPEDDSMTDSFIDKMDTFCGSLTNDFRVVRVTAMNALPKGTPFDVQQVVVAALLFNHLAYCAQDIWGMIYKQRDGKDETHPALAALMHQCELFASLYLKLGYKDSVINEKATAQIGKAMNILYRHITQWVVSDMNEN